MTGTTLHYIFDPLCGWCYGAAPLVKAAKTIPGLTIALHAGGMMTGNNRRQITDEWRNYVIPHDKRIAELTGQPFGEAYFNGLLRDTTAVMDSEPPITAILAAQALAGRGLDMLHRIQEAHYQEGRRIADTPVLEALAKSWACPLLRLSPKCGLTPVRQPRSTSRKAGHCLPRFRARGSQLSLCKTAKASCARSRRATIWATLRPGKSY